MKRTEMLIMVVIVAAVDAQTTTLNCGENVSASDYGRKSVSFVAGVSGRYTITTCSTNRGHGSCRVSYGNFEWPTQASTSMRISEYSQEYMPEPCSDGPPMIFQLDPFRTTILLDSFLILDDIAMATKGKRRTIS